eukprot:jgi/Orpsp1_1/1180464/evm.model.c7180000073521.1
MLSDVEREALFLSEKEYFIENGAEATYFQWLFSKGTNFTCYLDYLDGLNDEQKLNNKIDYIRTIIYSLHKPFQFTFFYWTLLIFILHKFNFKKPVMKVILAHFILRTIGDILDKVGDLLPRYYANENIKDINGIIIGKRCIIDSTDKERHPLKWFVTRQLAILFWFTGEIAGDWYPLLRTRAVARNQKSIWLVYITCGLFNLSKIAIIVLHWTYSPTRLYDSEGVYDKKSMNYFYFKYWVVHLIIIYTSVFYDISVFYVLKKHVFKVIQLESGFLKKFKTISEYRILVSAIISIIFLPLVSVTIFLKFYYLNKYQYHDLNFSFDEIRSSIANVQYFMIFIDQILLINSNKESSSGGVTSTTTSKKFNSKSQKYQYYSITNSGSNVMENSNQNTSINMMEYNKSYSSKDFDINLLNGYNNGKNIINQNNNNSSINNSTNDNSYKYGTTNINNNNNNNNNNTNYNNNNYNNYNYKYGVTNLSNNSFKNKSLANYDNFDSKTDEWNYLSK